MDVDFLISAVYDRPAIWDKRLKEHSNRVYLDKTWRELSEEMGCDETAVRKKWKSLRDYFMIEYSKRPVPRSGDSADICRPSKWQYFRQLLFLKDVVVPRPPYGSLETLGKEDPIRSGMSLNDPCPSAVTEGEASSYIDHSPLNDTQITTDDELDFPPTHNLSVAETEMRPVSSHTMTRKRKKKPQSNYQELTDIDYRKLKYQFTTQQNGKEKDDADMLFLKSLHPFMKEIPSHLKLSFRSSVQILLDEFIHGSPPSTVARGGTRTTSNTNSETSQ